MAQETMENMRRRSRTPRATQPVCVRIFPMSVTKIVENKRMMYPSIRRKELRTQNRQRFSGRKKRSIRIPGAQPIRCDCFYFCCLTGNRQLTYQKLPELNESRRRVLEPSHGPNNGEK